MPHRNRTERLLKALPGRDGWDEWDGGQSEPDGPAVEPLPAERRRFGPRRIAITIALTAVFATGAALSAVAGDQVRGLADSNDPSAVDGSVTDTTSTGDTTTTAPDTVPNPAPAPTTTVAPAPAPAPVAPAAPAPVPSSGQSAMSSNHVGVAPAALAPAKAPVSAVHTSSPARTAVARHVGLAAIAKPAHRAAKQRPKVVKARPPEIEGIGMPTVWLNSALPDPTPPSKRLSPKFAARLAATAKAAHIDWALMLGVLRVRGELGSAPAGAERLRALAAHLSDYGVKVNGWAAAFGLSGETTFADRVIALSHYYHAVGLRALVTGLEAAKPALEARVLNDPRLSIYSGGRHDVSSGRVDVRVLVVMEYLADTFNQVTVSCLITGHRLYARPGVISAHIYGRAVDIAALGGTSIAGHQGPGSLTESAVKDILLLPPEVFPQQVISLIGLGGPSFPLANHWDHIHIGY
jgi:hypothetical protein